MSMNPFLAILTLNPFFSVYISIVSCVNINLVAVITKLVVLVGVAARFAKPAELVLTELSPGPVLSVSVGLLSTKLVEANP